MMFLPQFFINATPADKYGRNFGYASAGIATLTLLTRYECD
jgi:hypothetical protein